MNRDLITVIMPVHNGEATLQEAVDSVLSQTMADWELWVIDDGSTDTTPALLAELAQRDERIKILTLPHQHGVGHARQQGLMHASGTYIAHLDADDVMHPQRLYHQRAVFERDSTAIICMSSIQFIALSPRTSPTWDTCIASAKRINALRYRLCWGNPITNSSVMVRREDALRAGGFDPTLTVAEDYAFFTALLKQPGNCWIIPTAMTAYRVHEGSTSRTQLVLMDELAQHIGYRWCAYWLNRPIEDSIPEWYRWLSSRGSDGTLSVSALFSTLVIGLNLLIRCPHAPWVEGLSHLVIALSKTMLGYGIGHSSAIRLFTRVGHFFYRNP